MANNRLIVQQGQTAGAIGGTYDVFGTNLGAETLTVFDGTTVNFQGDFSRGGDTIRLTDVATDFTVVIAGSNAILTSVSDGITIVVPIPNVGTLGTTIIFENGAGDIVDSRVLVFNGTNVVLGTQTLTTSSQAVAPNGNGNSQNSIILTAGVDTAPGGAADDTFIGFNKTLNAGDKLDGGTGFNTLSLSTDVSLTGVGDPAFTYGGFTTVNVQRIEVTNDDNLPVTLDLSGAKGVETVVALNSSMDTTFSQITGLNTGTNNDGNDIELNNVTNGAPADPTPDVTVQYQDSVVAGATTVDVLIKTSNADNLTIGSVSDANGGIETVNITNTAGASTLDTLDTDLTTLNILATKNLTIDDALNNTVRTINATGSTATLDIDFSDNDGAGEGVTYTGSAGVNLVQGGSAADNITTFDANDVIVTDDSIGFVDGNDTVNAGNGNNTVTSGIGADSITSGTGNDVINANNGNNIVNAGDGLNNVTTGTGNDTITTGKDADTISSGNGNDLITSGDGADLITIGAGEHTINSGAGADTVVAGANFDASTAAGPNVLDQMDFGADIDELQLNAGATDAKFTNVSNLEILTLTSAGTTTLNNGVGGNGDSAAQAAGINTINLSVGADSVNAADFTSALTINAANGGNDTVQTGSGSDVFNLGGALTDADSFNAGAGSDTLNLDGDVTVTGGGFTGFETVNLDDDESALGANSYSLTLTNSNAPNPSGVLTINGSALQSDEGAFISTAAVGSFNSNITTGAGNDTVISGAIADVITTNGGADTVNIKAGGFDNVNLGDGNDLLLAGGALTTNDTAVGGAGTDTVDVVDAARSIVDADFTNVTEFEVLNVAEAQANTLGAQAQEAGLLTIVSTNGTSGTVINASGYTAGVTVDISATGGGLNNDNVTTGSGNDTVIAGVGDQSVSLGAGDDQVVVDGSEFTFADTVSGGSNTAVGDSIVLDNTLGGVTAGVNLNNVTGVENFQFKADGNVGGGLFEPNASTITFTGGNVLTQTALNITAAALADTSDSLTVVIDGGQTDADFRFNVTGSVASTTVIKQNVDTNNDINFQGGTGVDRLEIHGNDLGSTVTMEGGAGRDVIAQTGGKFTDDGFVNINGVEILTATGGANIDATLGIRASGADLDTIQDTNNSDLVTLDAQFTNALTVNLSGGNDTINGAASAAVLTFNAIDSNLTAADSLTGGTTASDVLNVDAENGFADLTSVTKVETINIVDNDNPEPTDFASTTLLIDTQVADLSSGTVQTINGSALDASEVLNLQGAGAGANLAVTGGAGADMLTTGSGADTVDAGEGNNTVTTNAGADSVTSGSGNDTITTGTGADVVNAGDGNNLVYAGSEGDTVTTGGGSDSIDGGSGDDTISSGGGNDQIYGAAGLDVIDTGAGADQLLYRDRSDSSTSTGRDTVTGFTSGSDVIDVRYVTEAIANYGEGAAIKFAGNLGSFGDAQGATIAGDKIMDVVYDTSTGNLWVDLNDDGTLNGNDLQIVLNGVPTLQAKDVLDTAATGTVIGQTNVEFGGPAAVGTFLADNFVLVDNVPGGAAWTVDGGLGADKVQISGQDISGSSITNVETAVINGSGTMTYAQHNAFGAVVSGTGEPQSVNLTGPVVAVTGAATIETYNLLGTVDGIGNPAGDNFTLGASGQNVNAGSGNDTINSGAIEIVTGKIDGGLGTDVLNLDTGDDISGAALFGIESTVINLSSVTMNAEQHGSNGLNGSAGQIVDPGDTFPNTTDTITITTSTLAPVNIDAKNSVGFAGTGITGVPQVENYVLSNLDDKFTLGSLGQNVNTGGGTNEITTGASDGQYTGTIGGSGADTLTLDAGDNIGGVNTGFGVFGNGNGDLITGAANVSAVETLKLTTGTVQMTVAQHEGFTTVIDTGGADTVELTTGGTVNAEVVVDTYVAAGNTNTHLIVNSGNADVNFTAGDGVPGDYEDSVTVGSFAVNGKWAVDGTTDTLNATAGGADISGVNSGGATTLEILNLAGAITATEAQHDAFTTINAGGVADSFTLTSSNGDDSVTGNAAVESYTLNDAFTFTLGSASQNVTGNGGNNQTVVINGLTLSGNTLNGGLAGSDTLTINTGSNISGATSITEFENVTVNGAVSMTYAQYNALLPVGGAGVADTITLTGTPAAILGRTGIENYVLANANGNDFTFHASTKNVTTSGSNNDIIRTDGVLSFAGVTLELAGNDGFAGDVLFIDTTGTNITGINGGTETTAETINIVTNGTVTMTVAQHEGFTAPFIAAGNETVAIFDNGIVNAEAAIENYDLSTGANTLNVNPLNTSVTIKDIGGGGDNDTVNIGGLTVANAAGSWNLSNANDVLVATNGANISGVNGGAATTLETLQLTGGITMTELQHDAITTFTAPGAADSITLSASNGNNEVTGKAAIETYTLNDTFYFYIGAANQSVIGSGDHQQLINATNMTLTGTINGGSGPGDLINPFPSAGGNGDEFVAVGNVDITAANFSNFEAIFLDTNANLTMTELQYESVAAGQYFITGGSTTITLASSNGNDTVSADADILNYVLNDQFTINLVDGDTNVTGNAANNQNVVFDTNVTATNTQSGTLNGGAGGSDTLSLFGITNINTASVTNFENLVIGGAGAVALSSGTASMTTGQYNQFTAITDLGGAADQITFTDGGVVTSDNDIDTYVMSGGSVDITLAAGSGSTNLTSTGAGSDIVRITDTVSGIWSLAGAADQLHATGTTNITGVTTTSVEQLFLDGSLTLTSAQYNSFTAITDGTAVGAAATADTVTITTNGTIVADDQIENYIGSGAVTDVDFTFSGSDAVRAGQSAQMGASNTGTVRIDTTAVESVLNGTDSSISLTQFSALTNTLDINVNGVGMNTDFENVNAGTNTDLDAGIGNSNNNGGIEQNGVIVINGLANINLNDISNNGDVETAIGNAIGGLKAGTYVVVLEDVNSGASNTSGVYAIRIAADVAELDSTNFDVEYLAFVDHGGFSTDWVPASFV